MRILRKDDLLDLEAPIFVRPKDIESFKNKMIEVFGQSIIFTSINEQKLNFGKSKNNRKYTKEEAIMLSKIDIDEEEVSKKISKSPRAIKLKHSRQLKKIFEQAKKENKSFSDPENIGGFIEDEFRKD
jgi:hypothetical protein